MTATVLIECTGVWISSVGCGLSWKAKQFKVVSKPDSVGRGYGFVDEDEAPRAAAARSSGGAKASFAAAFDDDEEEAVVDEEAVVAPVAAARPPVVEEEPAAVPKVKKVVAKIKVAAKA